MMTQETAVRDAFWLVQLAVRSRRDLIARRRPRCRSLEERILMITAVHRLSLRDVELALASGDVSWSPDALPGSDHSPDSEKPGLRPVR